MRLHTFVCCINIIINKIVHEFQYCKSLEFKVINPHLFALYRRNNYSFMPRITSKLSLPAVFLGMLPCLSDDFWVWFPLPVSVMLIVKQKRQLLEFLSQQDLSFRASKTK